MRLQRELDGSRKPTGAYWYAGRRIARCAKHARRWRVEGLLVELMGWPCGCFKDLTLCAYFIQEAARPDELPTPNPVSSSRHLRLVVSR